MVLLSIGTLALALLTASTIDFQYLRLPDWITLPLIVLGLVLAAVGNIDELPSLALAVVIGFSIFASLAVLYQSKRNANGLGLGDAKLLAAVGAWLGPWYLAPVIFVSALLALMFVLILRLRGQTITSTTVVPFGPFLSAAFFGFWCLKTAGWQIP